MNERKFKELRKAVEELEVGHTFLDFDLAEALLHIVHHVIKGGKNFFENLDEVHDNLVCILLLSRQIKPKIVEDSEHFIKVLFEGDKKMIDVLRKFVRDKEKRCQKGESNKADK